MARFICGSGCALGDICAEWLVFTFPAIAIALGWQSVFHEKIFAVWTVDYLFAYAFGIVFQYFTVAPMRGLSFGEAIVAAIKADTLTLTAWRAGMYGFMAIAYFAVFRYAFGVNLQVNSAVLVHDADCDALWLYNIVSGQLVANPEGHQGKDVSYRCGWAKLE
jgi:branched-subunit amino acid transport protein